MRKKEARRQREAVGDKRWGLDSGRKLTGKIEYQGRKMDGKEGSSLVIVEPFYSLVEQLMKFYLATESLKSQLYM